MTQKASLSATDRAFFHLVNEVAFVNPFSDEREELDRRLAGISGGISAAEVAELAVAKVLKKVAELEAKGKADHRLFSTDDGKLVRNALLFYVYYRHFEDFDRLISEQIQAGDPPCPVPFATDVLAELCRCGFTQNEATRYFALFYQIRRAFFFIDRSLVGLSPSMRKLRCHLWNNVFTADLRWFERFLWNRMEDFSTLMLGETGTGKGAAAAAIGRSCFIPFDERRSSFSESFTRNFIELNLSQFPEALIESELFGHKKGAFTGAIEDQQGVFSRCSPHGSIFLDEIGEVSAPVQVKLLQVLQERIFTPVGSRRTERFAGRVIAATNKSMEELRQRGAFRDDFFYRLCSDVITVPPLRLRLREDPSELEALLEHMVNRTLGEPSAELVEVIKGILHQKIPKDYPWPGNVRELEQAIRRILLTRDYGGDIFASGDFTDLGSGLHHGISSGTLDARTLLTNYCALLYQRHGTYEEVSRRTGLDRRTVKKYILSVGNGHPVIQSGGNQSAPREK